MTDLSETRLQALSDRLDIFVARVDRYASLSERRLAESKRAAESGDTMRSEQRARASFKAAGMADLWRGRAQDLEREIDGLRKRQDAFLSERERLTEAATRFVDRLKATADRKPPKIQEPLSEKQQRKEKKLERLTQQGERARTKDHASANIVYDPRLASGRREFEIQNLGGSKRARANPFKKLFRNPAEATTERVLTCERYDELWHAAHMDQMPAPRFEPGVDTSTVPGVMNGNAYAHQQLTALQRRIGDEAAAMLYARVVMGFGYRAMEADGHGDERRLSIAFVNAVDAAACFFGLKRNSMLVSMMNASLGNQPNG